jgi:hypothetical protein
MPPSNNVIAGFNDPGDANVNLEQNLFKNSLLLQFYRQRLWPKCWEHLCESFLKKSRDPGNAISGAQGDAHKVKIL